MQGLAVLAFDGMLPTDALVVEARVPKWWESGLLPEELSYVARATDKRRREFTAGRNCVRTALACLGLPAVAIGVGPERESLFAASVSSGITLTAGYCAAAIVQRGDVSSIGIDAEVDATMEEGIARLIMNEAERAALRAHAHLGNVDLLAFSLKEAFYKAAYPFCRPPLGFKEVAIRLTDRGSEIEVLSPRLAADLAGQAIDARFGFYPDAFTAPLPSRSADTRLPARTSCRHHNNPHP